MENTESAFDALRRTVAREKRRLHSRLDHLDRQAGRRVQAGQKRRVGRLYEVFQALNDS